MSVLVLLDPLFPAAGALPDATTVFRLVPGTCRTVGAADLGTVLQSDSVRLIVSFHGPFFPKAAWPALRRFFAAGGSWCSFGGAPFTRPCVAGEGGWTAEPPQVAYLQECRIRQALQTEIPEPLRWVPGPGADFLDGIPLDLPHTDLTSLTVRFTDKNDHPEHLGSSGPIDASLTALVYGYTAEGVRSAAPVVAIDHLQEPLTGSRWVMANFPAPAGWWDSLSALALVPKLVAYAAEGALAFRVLPELAAYHPGEQPAVQVWARHFGAGEAATLEVRLSNESGVVAEAAHPLSLDAVSWHSRIALPAASATGLYRVAVTLRSPSRLPVSFETGYWVYNPEMLEQGPAITVDEAGFLKNGERMWVAGTTYMAGDVSRKFYLLPNPALWDREMAEIRGAGLNLVRTGLWTAFRQATFIPGAPPEAVMRAFDAFLLTANKHDLAVVFNFFAFFPEPFEGENPWLDPRALQGQRDFIAAFARRWKNVPYLHWDLINEPSFGHPKRIFNFRPIPSGDRFERADYAAWLKRKHESAGQLQLRWRATPAEVPDFGAAQLPEPADYAESITHTDANRPMRVFDYTLYAQEGFRVWADDMRRTIRACGAAQPITVGQDEAECRPTPFFHADAIEYTSNHTWWNNDDLLWDAVIARVPGKPLVVEESGVMFVKDLDGRGRRTEQECAALLERKGALALAGNAVGLVQWCWTTNIHMASDNEVAIGALRADGSEKPEAGVLRDFGRFVGSLEGEVGPGSPVAVIIPHSYMFSVRNGASEATRKAVRTLAYQLGVVPEGISEYATAKLGSPRLILLPSPRVLTEQAWQDILAAVKTGAILLATGPVDADEYWLPAGRLSKFGLNAATEPVRREERFVLGGVAHRCAFSGDRIARVEKAVLDGAAHGLHQIAYGKGQIWWTGLPLELAETDVLPALYSQALQAAGVAPGYTRKGEADPALLLAARPLLSGTLYSAVNEGAGEAVTVVVDHLSGRTVELRLPAGRAAAARLGADGRLTASYGHGTWSVK